VKIITNRFTLGVSSPLCILELSRLAHVEKAVKNTTIIVIYKVLMYIHISANYITADRCDTQPPDQTIQEPRASQDPPSLPIMDKYVPQTNINNTYIYTNSLCTRPIFVKEISSPLTSMVI